jgi:hypothetical protein
METSPEGGISPLQDPTPNPFPVEDPLHEVFESFTRKAEIKLFLFEAAASWNRPTAWEYQGRWLFQSYVTAFKIWPERDLCTVLNDKTARVYGQWWESILLDLLDDLEANPPPGVMHARFLEELRYGLLAWVKWWSAKALGQAVTIQSSVGRLLSFAKDDLRMVRSRKDVPAYQQRLEAFRQDLLKQTEHSEPDPMLEPSRAVLTTVLLRAEKRWIAKVLKALEQIAEMEAHAGTVTESTSSSDRNEPAAGPNTAAADADFEASVAAKPKPRKHRGRRVNGPKLQYYLSQSGYTKAGFARVLGVGVWIIDSGLNSKRIDENQMGSIVENFNADAQLKRLNGGNDITPADLTLPDDLTLPE